MHFSKSHLISNHHDCWLTSSCYVFMSVVYFAGGTQGLEPTCFLPRRLSYINLPSFLLRLYRSVLQLSFFSLKVSNYLPQVFYTWVYLFALLLYHWGSFWCWPFLLPLNTRLMQLATSTDSSRADKTVCWLIILVCVIFLCYTETTVPSIPIR